MINVALLTALAMGLTGSLHCAGMCGPIMLVLPFRTWKGYRKWFAILLYHSGRITVYALLGWFLYSFKSLFDPRWQQYVAMGTGLLLLLAGLWSFFPKGKISLPWMGVVQLQLGRLMGHPSPTAMLLAGMLNGLLPCGLVYMALSLSMAAGSSLQAIMLMYAFGAGTLPMLLGITVMQSRIKLFSAGRIRQWVPLVLFVFGSLFIVRGMNLGIPYLSPKIEVSQHKIKANCCHKPIQLP